jgi:methylase of polypeptide subunit release factors
MSAGAEGERGREGGGLSTMIAPSVEDVVARAAGWFAAAGFDQPRRGALRLWAAVAGTTSGEAWRRRGEAPMPDVRARFERAVARRLEGVPFAYAAGSAAFRTLELKVDERVLIPRPDGGAGRARARVGPDDGALGHRGRHRDGQWLRGAESRV